MVRLLFWNVSSKLDQIGQTKSAGQGGDIIEQAVFKVRQRVFFVCIFQSMHKITNLKLVKTQQKKDGIKRKKFEDILLKNQNRNQ